MTCWRSSWDAKVPFAILCSILVNNSGLSHPFLLFFLLLSSSSEGNISEWVPIGNYHVTKNLHYQLSTVSYDAYSRPITNPFHAVFIIVNAMTGWSFNWVATDGEQWIAEVKEPRRKYFCACPKYTIHTYVLLILLQHHPDSCNISSERIMHYHY